MDVSQISVIVHLPSLDWEVGQTSLTSISRTRCLQQNLEACPSLQGSVLRWMFQMRFINSKLLKLLSGSGLICRWKFVNGPHLVFPSRRSMMKINIVGIQFLQIHWFIRSLKPCQWGGVGPYFFANETISYLAGGESPRAAPEFRERMVAPQLWSSDALVSTYVDNVSIIGASRSAVLRKADEVTKVFEELQIPVVWSQSEPVKQLETVGIILDFDRKVVRNKHSRIWRVYLAGREIARRSRVRGEVVEAWLGHTTFLMRLAPFLLSIFTSIYRFVQISRGKRYVLWPSVRAEILQACSLIWFARAHLGGKYIHDVDMGDSSGFGYALMTATWSPEEIHLASQFRERWRYVPFPDDLKDAIEKQDFQGMFERRDDERTRAFIRAGAGA